MSDIARISLLVLSVLVCLGGVMGFIKAQSKASLTAGIISGALLAAAYSVAQRNFRQGAMFGAVIAALLCVVFGIRLAKTKSFMPSGMMLAVCAIELIFLIVTLVSGT
jgi:uncharacterized membrane protein (UPF0136 family)